MSSEVHSTTEPDEVATLVISWETDAVRCEKSGEDDYLLKNEKGPGAVSAPREVIKEAVPRLKNAGIAVSGDVSG